MQHQKGYKSLQFMGVLKELSRGSFILYWHENKTFRPQSSNSVWKQKQQLRNWVIYLQNVNLENLRDKKIPPM